MKREIKFRVWDKVECKICGIKVMTDEGCYLLGVKPRSDQIYNDGKLFVLAPQDGRFCYYENFELMQFTGLLDENGVEIYEGDIIKFGNVEEVECEIIWVDNICQYRMNPLPRYSKYMENGWDLNRPTIEVIGNIYENPELLK